MITLGIETSCDETAVAVVGDRGEVHVNLVSSQVARHAPYGGVVPEIASREHLAALPLLVADAVGRTPGPIGLVAVTARPGLVGALLVGVRFAAAFAWARELPLVAVDHLEGHLESPFLSLDGAPARRPSDRVLALVASGGHSSWYLVADGRAQRLGRTRDDAAGETFDKVAQALGLDYPGGPVVDRLAERGDPGAVDLPRPRIKEAPADMSFSGLKSAAVRWIRSRSLTGVGETALPAEALDLLASFRTAVVDSLLAPLPELVSAHRPDLVVASGGVAANALLRRRMTAAGEDLGVDVLLPPPALTTDNAAMIARRGQLDHAAGSRSDPRRIDAAARVAWQPPGMRGRMAGPRGVR